ncbi:hypothetical protein HUT18_08035 [Streptomyces sp. NA04227]|uniref:hypothetical protein n=1 Tax=Streptomyces sp. NA04227 TaxID=2742136 RepID=UPI001592533E|nr:hypothetical protein [Streptomyces sp. NA04227]QKW06356.1 hypothetical protein HUT18_08035 [Streptomyces sp. NA04227]
MRTVRMLAPVALALAAVGPAAADALAADGPALRVYPASAEPGATVTVNTAACAADGTAHGDASTVGAEAFTLAPSAHESEVIGQFRVPVSAQPGTYEIRANCPGGGVASGDLVLTLAGAGRQVSPRGPVHTGVGGALGPDPLRTGAGVAALAVAAAGGTWLLHRKARGDGF